MFFPLAITFVLFTLCVNTLNAQNEISISGKVVLLDQIQDQDDPLIMLKLFQMPDTTYIQGGIISSDGKFNLTSAPGVYMIQISSNSYQTFQSESFELKKDQENYHFGTIRLVALKSQDVKDITVRGQKDLMETAFDKKVYNVAQDLNVNGGTANDILNKLPSVDVDQDGGVLLRGQGGVTILIDGRPSSLSGGNGKTLLDALPANSIERVEIITNPSAKYDPDGSSGIINIVLKKNKLLGFNGLLSTNLATGNLNGGNVGEGNASLSYRNGNFNVFGSYNARYLEGYRNNYNDIRQDLSSGTFILDQNRIGTDLDAGQTIRIGTDINLNPQNTLGMIMTSAFATRDRTGDLWNGQLDTNYQLTDLWERISYDPTHRHNYDINLNFKHDFKAEKGNFVFDMSSSLGKEFIEGYYDNIYYTVDTLISFQPSQFQRLFNTEQNNITTAQADLIYLFPNLGIRTESGLKAILRDQLVDTYSESAYVVPVDFQEDTLANFLYGYKEQIYSAYGVAAKQFNKIKAQIGLRTEKAFQIPNLISDSIRIVNDYFNLFPSAHLRYEMKEKSELSVSYSKRINRASAGNLNPFTNYSDPFNLRRGNPYLRPEFIHSFDLAYSLEKKKLVFSTALYFRMANDVISRIKEFYPDNTSAVTFMNIAQTKSLGYEMIMNLKPIEAFRSTISYNSNYTWFYSQDSTLGNRKGFNHNIKWNSSYEFWNKTATLQLSVNYNGPRVTLQGTVQRKGPIDMAFEKRFANGNWVIGTRVTDIFNRQGFYYFIDRPGIYQSGEYKWLTRRVYLSISYKFGKLENLKKAKITNSTGGSDF